MLFQNISVNCFVLFAEYVENDFDSTVVFAFPVFYGLDGDLGGTIGWEVEDPGGNIMISKTTVADMVKRSGLSEAELIEGIKKLIEKINADV